jgi:hypothetical protein
MTDTDSTTRVVNRRSVSRYDILLAVIPMALVWCGLLAYVLGVGLEMGLLIGGIIGALALLDAVLLNPPRGPQAGGRTA